MPTPTKPVKAGQGQAAAAPGKPGRQRYTVTAENNHRHAFASLSRMMGPCCGKLLGLLIVVALSGAGYLLLTSDGRQLLDRATINYTRWQNNWYHRDGLPLPGTPDLAKFDERLKAQGVALGAPVFCASSSSSPSSRSGWRRTAAMSCCHLSDLPVVGTARPEAPRRRPPVAGGLLCRDQGRAQSEQPLAPPFSLGFPMRSTARMAAPAHSSWCMAAASRSAASP